MKTVTHSSSGLIEAIASDLANFSTAVGIGVSNQVGTRTGSPLTGETAVLVNLKIGRRYRGGKPRVYFPGGTSGDLLSPQSWTSTFTSAFQTQFSGLVSTILSSGGMSITLDHLVNVSYHSGHALRPTPVVDTVLSWNTSSIPGSQRRRMGR